MLRGGRGQQEYRSITVNIAGKDHREPEWLAQAIKGNAEAFTNLIELYQRPVFNLCYRMLGDPDEAEDAAQETFLRAYNGLKRYDAQRSFSTWLLSIAAHFCIDQMRRRHFTLLSMDTLPHLDPPDMSPGPETALSLGEEQRRVRVLLGSLNAVDRAAVVMRYWYELSYEEIAESLSLTVSAVKSRLHRSRLEMADNWTTQNKQLLPVERRQHESPAF
jgi:RNA polymerase sigma-70 factor (ECF subfamily)